jgi:hypothetical protein
MLRIDFVHSHSWDWVGLYLNGKYVMQGHSFRKEDLLSTILDYAGVEYEINTTTTDLSERGLPAVWPEVEEE